MRLILTILTLCTLATSLRADTRFRPSAFDFQDQFNQCLKAWPENIGNCQGILTSSFTLRREIGNALQACIYTNAQGCVDAFNAAGFPADRLNIANRDLDACDMINLDESDALEIPERSCIEQLAYLIERDSLPTTHDTSMLDRIERAEIVLLGSNYWQQALEGLFQEKLQAIPASGNDQIATSHRYYSLRERQHRLRIDLAEADCRILTVVPHWGNPIDYQSCMGRANADIWIALQEEW